MAITKELIEQLEDSNTALVCNAIDALGLTPVHSFYMDGTIKSLSPGLPALVGEAITIKVDSSSPGGEEDEHAYWAMIEEISRSRLPRVVVVQTIGSDRNRECVAGDGTAKMLVSVGAAGLVTDGGMRDIQGIIDQGFRVFGSGAVVQHAALRWSALGEPVEIGGITIKAGDLIHGDSGGCIVIPEENHSAIVRACQYVLDFEKEAHVLLRQTGIPLQDKRAQLGRLAERHMGNIKSIGRTQING